MRLAMIWAVGYGNNAAINPLPINQKSPQLSHPKHDMKRHGYVYETIISFDNNLVLAAHNAQRGKRSTLKLKFNHNLEAKLISLQTELTHQTYRTFEIYEPKPSFIAAAPYRDRADLTSFISSSHDRFARSSPSFAIIS
jgi:branched-subunit amino acid aminotransferase/4-amino-4-deoxychorismate lyase